MNSNYYCGSFIVDNHVREKVWVDDSIIKKWK